VASSGEIIYARFSKDDRFDLLTAILMTAAFVAIKSDSTRCIYSSWIKGHLFVGTVVSSECRTNNRNNVYSIIR
jgi:hypothetical protein